MDNTNCLTYLQEFSLADHLHPCPGVVGRILIFCQGLFLIRFSYSCNIAINNIQMMIFVKLLFRVREENMVWEGVKNIHSVLGGREGGTVDQNQGAQCLNSVINL